MEKYFENLFTEFGSVKKQNNTRENITSSLTVLILCLVKVNL